MSLSPEMTIMVVEDSRITRMMEINVLRELGFDKIIQAEDGEAAINKLQEGVEVNLIISDWNMPNMDGYELLVWVRSDEEYREIPFIMATAQASKAQIAKAKEAGVNNFISKPFAPPELKEVIEKTFKEIEDGADIEVIEERMPEITKSGKVLFKVAHIQITDHLALGVLKYLIANKTFEPKFFELETKCMTSWNPVQNSLEKGTVDAAFVLAPISMDLFGYGLPIKLILFAHKNGSICVRNVRGASQSTLVEFYREKIFYIPHILSIHHMLSDITLKQLGLKPGLAGHEKINVFMEVIPPIEMPKFLASSNDVAGYLVAEPLGSKAIGAGNANLMFLSGEIWENHPCCVCAMRNIVIDNFPQAVQEFTTLLVQAGKFISKKPEKAAEIAVSFLDPQKKLGLKQPVLEKVLKEPKGIKTNDLFPVIEDLEVIQRYMSEELKVSSKIDLNSFVYSHFAENACGPKALNRRLYSVPDLINNVSKIMFKKGAEYLHKDNVNKQTHIDNKAASESVDDHYIMSKDVDCVKYFCSLKKAEDNDEYIAKMWKSKSGCHVFVSYSEAYRNQNKDQLLELVLSNIDKYYYQKDFENIIFKRIERRMRSKIKINKKISGIFIDIDTQNHNVKVVSLDHPPIIFLRNNYPMPRAINALSSNDTNNYNGKTGNVQFKVFPKSKLFLHSDYLANKKNSKASNKNLYLDAIDDLIARYREKDLNQLHSSLWEDFLKFYDDQQANDIFLLSIEIL